MDNSYNRDNFERLGLYKSNFDFNNVVKNALDEHSSKDLEIDQKNTKDEKNDQNFKNDQNKQKNNR